MQFLWHKLHLYLKDRLFLVLLAITAALYFLDLAIRHPALERSSMPFDLVTLFTVVNVLFACLSLPRDALLAYMFLAASIVIDSVLFFFIRSLLAV